MDYFFLNWTGLDFVIAGILFVSLVIGFVRGFAKEFISLLAWVAAFYAALRFSSDVDQLLQSAIPDTITRYIVSVVLIFAVVLLLGCLISKLVHSLLKLTGFGFFDRLLGILFGLARGFVLATILLLVISLTSYQNAAWVTGSQFSPYYANAVTQASAYLPPEIKEISSASAVINRLAILTHDLRTRN